MRCAAVKASGWDPWVLIARPVSFRTVAHQMPWSLTTDGLWGFSRSEWSFIALPFVLNLRRSRVRFVFVLRRLLGLRSRTSRGVRFSSGVLDSGEFLFEVLEVFLHEPDFVCHAAFLRARRSALIWSRCRSSTTL